MFQKISFLDIVAIGPERLPSYSYSFHSLFNARSQSLGIELQECSLVCLDPEKFFWRNPSSQFLPLAGKSALAAGGKKLFMREYVECHGEDGKGLEKKHSANFHLPVVQDQSDGALFWKITNGNPDRGMPSFSKLPEMQRWQLVLYIRTLKSSGEFGKGSTSEG